MTAVAFETAHAQSLISRVETLEDVAGTLPKGDHRRVKLLEVVEQSLAEAPPLRPRIAAALLDLSEKTVRSWLAEGVLVRAEGPSSRVLLDTRQVHDVMHLVRSMRAAGTTRGLLDQVHRRLVDATWLQREDLTESLEQMRRGDGATRVAKPAA